MRARRDTGPLARGRQALHRLRPRSCLDAFCSRLFGAGGDIAEVSGRHLGVGFHIGRLSIRYHGALIEDVMRQLNLARATVSDYLAEFIRTEKPRSIAEWVDAKLPTETKDAPKQATPEPGALKG